MGHPLYQLLNKLDASGSHYVLSRHRPDALMVTVAFVGERVEVEVFEDGHMEVARFSGSENIEGGEDLILRLIKDNEEKDAQPDWKPQTKTE